VLRRQKNPQHLCKILSLVGESRWCLLLVGSYLHLSEAAASTCVCVWKSPVCRQSVTLLASDDSTSETSVPAKNNPSLTAHRSWSRCPNTSWTQWPNKLSSGTAGFHRQLLLGVQHGAMKRKAGDYTSLAGHQTSQPAGLMPEGNSSLGQIVQAWRTESADVLYRRVGLRT